MQDFIVLTLFPEMFPGPLGYSVIGRSLGKKWNLHIVNIRDFALDKRKRVDDRIYGGGPGMVLKPDVLGSCIDNALSLYKPDRLVYFSPRGRVLNGGLISQFKESSSTLMLCGRYEGVDQRILDYYKFEEISLGNFVLSGGEIPAYAFIDACVRLIPGVIKNEEAVIEESFGQDDEYSSILEYNIYTRPVVWNGLSVPDFLLSGNHGLIKNKRKQEAVDITRSKNVNFE